MQIKSKRALVTGVARGIGQTIAKELARVGADIYGVDLRLADLQQTASLVEETGQRFRGFACDIAVEAAQNAEKTFHSTRRGYHYVPKYFFGRPSDQIGEASLRLRLPTPIRRFINSTLLNLLVGRPENFGLPKPDHKLFQTHPIVNSQIFYYLGHGDITPKPDIEELRTEGVRFKDGSTETIDLIVYATGFNISFPFIDQRYLNWREGRPDLFMNIFHPDFDQLFFAGLIQPDSGQWGLVDYQTQLIAHFIDAQRRGDRVTERFRKLKAVPTAYNGRYLKSSRHLLEVEHFSYRRDLQKLIRLFV